MNEMPERRLSSPIRAAIIIAGSVAFLLGAAGVAFYLGWLPNPWLFFKSPEHSARYYPDNTLAYAWVTLNPGDGQRGHMMDIWNRLGEYSAFREWKDDTQDAIWRETGIDMEDDLLPWFGPEASLGILDFDFDSADFDGAVTIDVRNRDAAKDFLLDWLDYWEEEYDADFDRHSNGDFDVWNDEQNGDAFALSDSLMIAATSERILDRILERVSGENDKTLLADKDFNDARDALPTRRFTSVYVNAKRAIPIIEDSDAGDYLDSEFYDDIPDWIASSAGWVERGMALDVVAPHPTSGAGQYINVPTITDVARLMPQDTVGLLALGFDPDLQNWRNALEEYDFSELSEEMEEMEEFGLSGNDFPFDPANLNFAHMLDFGLLGFDVLTGIDLERDFFAHLEGELVVGVREFDYKAISDNPERHAVDAAALLSYSTDREQALESTLEDFMDWLQSFEELDIDSVDIGADRDAVLVDLDGIAYSPGYVLHDGYLSIATTDNMLKRIIQLQNGEGDSLESDDEYRRISQYIEKERDMLLYFNLHRLTRLVENDDELELSNSQQRLLQESLGSIAMSTTSDDRYNRFKAAVTLFPETE